MRITSGLACTAVALAALTQSACAHDDVAAAGAADGDLDVTRLSVGDGRVTTSGARRGWVYACRTPMGGAPGARGGGPWIDGSTWDLTQKPTVDGTVRWDGATYRVRRRGSRRAIAGNGLPAHATGTFPIQPSDDAYEYDRNPNPVASAAFDVELPASPRKAARPSCLGMGAIGVLDSGAVLYDALDAGGRDAAAHELQDACGGHPQQSGQYHYHALPACSRTGPSKAHSRRLGWAFDGFPIYGPRGEGGEYARNSALDACHGHTHAIELDGRRRRAYHYHATMEYPYTLGCFRGTPAA